jgi:hypothetical protein
MVGSVGAAGGVGTAQSRLLIMLVSPLIASLNALPRNIDRPEYYFSKSMQKISAKR